MVSILKSVQMYDGALVELFCLSSDTKPTAGIANGSKLEELNASTGVITEYRFNAAGPAWVEIVAATPETVEGGD